MTQLHVFRNHIFGLLAHRHYNDPAVWGSLPGFIEEGGWVANTVFVDPTAYIGPDVEVLGNASIGYRCVLTGFMTVCKDVQRNTHPRWETLGNPKQTSKRSEAMGSTGRLQ